MLISLHDDTFRHLYYCNEFFGQLFFSAEKKNKTNYPNGHAFEDFSTFWQLWIARTTRNETNINSNGDWNCLPKGKLRLCVQVLITAFTFRVYNTFISIYLKLFCSHRHKKKWKKTKCPVRTNIQCMVLATMCAVYVCTLPTHFVSIHARKWTKAKKTRETRRLSRTHSQFAFTLARSRARAHQRS